MCSYCLLGPAPVPNSPVVLECLVSAVLKSMTCPLPFDGHSQLVVSVGSKQLDKARCHISA